MVTFIEIVKYVNYGPNGMSAYFFIVGIVFFVPQVHSHAHLTWMFWVSFAGRFYSRFL